MNAQMQGTFRRVAMVTDSGAGDRTRRASAAATPIPHRNERSRDSALWSPFQQWLDALEALVIGQGPSSRSPESLLGSWSPFQQWLDALEALVIDQGRPQGRGTIQLLPLARGPQTSAGPHRGSPK